MRAITTYCNLVTISLFIWLMAGSAASAEPAQTGYCADAEAGAHTACEQALAAVRDKSMDGAALEAMVSAAAGASDTLAAVKSLALLCELHRSQKQEAEARACLTRLDGGSDPIKTITAAVHLAHALAGEASTVELWHYTFNRKPLDRPQAEFWANHAVTVARTRAGSGSPVTIDALEAQAGILAATGKLTQAEGTLHLAEITERQLHGPDSLRLGDLALARALLSHAQGRHQGEELGHLRALEIYERRGAPNRQRLWVVLSALGNLYINGNRPAEAERVYRRGLALNTAPDNEADAVTANALAGLAQALWQQGRTEETETLFKRALAIQERLTGGDERQTLLTIALLASFYLQTGNPDLTEAMAARLQTAISHGGTDADVAAEFLGDLNTERKRPEDALYRYQQARDLRNRMTGPHTRPVWMLGRKIEQAERVLAETRGEASQGTPPPPPDLIGHTGIRFHTIIPVGPFLMGSPDSDPDAEADEKPHHAVTIRQPFQLATYPVTLGEFRAFLASRPDLNTVEFNQNNSLTEDTPVTGVSWDDAQGFITWLNQTKPEGDRGRYRLPTEAEWEYAARAGFTTRYGWGDQIGQNRANCQGCGDSWPKLSPAPVHTFRPNRFGLFGMAGNVAQWVEDCYHNSYAGAPADGSAWVTPDCSSRVLRGGSFVDGPAHLRAAFRNNLPLQRRGSYFGFRVARTPPSAQ